VMPGSGTLAAAAELCLSNCLTARPETSTQLWTALDAAPSRIEPSGAYRAHLIRQRSVVQVHLGPPWSEAVGAGRGIQPQSIFSAEEVLAAGRVHATRLVVGGHRRAGHRELIANRVCCCTSLLYRFTWDASGPSAGAEACTTWLRPPRSHGVHRAARAA
jgi:hypothetical protein